MKDNEAEIKGKQEIIEQPIYDRSREYITRRGQ